MGEKRRTKRRKPPSLRRDEYLRVRLTPDQRTAIWAAAEQAGITVSAWAVERLVRAAREEARRAQP